MRMAATTSLNIATGHQVPEGTKPPVARAQKRELSFSLSMLMVLIVSVAAVGLAIIAGISTAPPSDRGDEEFVPAGKVRHIVLDRRIEGDLSKASDILLPLTGTIDLWYAKGRNGINHHVYYNDYNRRTGKTKTSEIWVVDGTMYTPITDEERVLWQPWSYDPIYAPNANLISNLLQQPNARIISDTVIDGRNTVVISWPDSSGEQQQWWIDKDTNRPYQWRAILAPPGSDHSGVISIVEIVVDEVLDADTLPPDFFKFKLPEGFRLVERVIPTPRSTPGATVTP
jgi:hypothetical protein